MRIPEDLQKEFGEKKMIKRGEGNVRYSKFSSEKLAVVTAVLYMIEQLFFPVLEKNAL